MDLFDYMREKTQEQESPLASRMRPQMLEEVVGQQHIIGKDKLLYRAIKADKLGSIIFYGPPGTGKTTLAKVIAHTTSAEFKQIDLFPEMLPFPSEYLSPEHPPFLRIHAILCSPPKGQRRPLHK